MVVMRFQGLFNFGFLVHLVSFYCFVQLHLFSSLYIAYLDQSLHTGERQALCSLLRILPFLNIFQQDIPLSLFLFTALCGLQDPSSLTQD